MIDHVFCVYIFNMQHNQYSCQQQCRYVNNIYTPPLLSSVSFHTFILRTKPGLFRFSATWSQLDAVPPSPGVLWVNVDDFTDVNRNSGHTESPAALTSAQKQCDSARPFSEVHLLIKWQWVFFLGGCARSCTNIGVTGHIHTHGDSCISPHGCQRGHMSSDGTAVQNKFGFRKRICGPSPLLLRRSLAAPAALKCSRKYQEHQL